ATNQASAEREAGARHQARGGPGPGRGGAGIVSGEAGVLSVIGTQTTAAPDAVRHPAQGHRVYRGSTAPAGATRARVQAPASISAAGVASASGRRLRTKPGAAPSTG